MKKVAALLVLALAAVALVACGSSSSSSESTADRRQPARRTTGGAETEPAPGGGSVVKIEAAEGSELAYTTKDATAKAGKVTIDFTNPQPLSHDVAIEDSSGKKVGETELVAGGKTVATIGDLKPGTYTFYCTVPGHREAGMEGTLTVK